MKQLIATLFTGASLLLAPAAWAECHVFVPVCPNNPALNNQSFKDNDPVALRLPNRCMERAREYYNYCGVRAETGVTTIFYMANGTPALAQSVSRGGSQTYAIDGTGKVWTPLKHAY